MWPWRRRAQRVRAPELREVGAGDLSDEERTAVRSVVEAVAARDHSRVGRHLDPAWIPHPEALYTEADDFGRLGRLTLEVPPGDLAEWELLGGELAAGGVWLDVPMWSREEGGRSDLILGLQLMRSVARAIQLNIRALHVQ